MGAILEFVFKIMEINFSVAGFTITLWQVFLFCTLGYILLAFIFSLFYKE